MRALKITEHISLDGVIQSSGEDGFPYTEWTVSYRTPTGRRVSHGVRSRASDRTYPVLLGTGKRFFAEGTPARTFELVGPKALPSGIVLSNYKVAGPLKTG